MKSRRNRVAWVLEPESRITLDQKIGGLLYDFIDERSIHMADGTRKKLLSCVRESSFMNDNTLKKYFLGISSRPDTHYRLLFSLQKWITECEFVELQLQLNEIVRVYGEQHSDEYLIAHRNSNQPKRR